MNPPLHPVDKACQRLSMTLEELGVELGVTKGAVSQWKREGKHVPAGHCPKIEELTHGYVTRKEMRPNDWHRYWPELIDQNKAA